jgi:hypothetical protein
MKWESISFEEEKKEELINVSKDTTDSGLECFEDEKYKKFVQKCYQVIDKINDLGLPEKEEQLRIVTFKTFNASIFLKYLADNFEIEECIMVVYSINAEAGLMINDLVEKGKIKKCKILMSNLRNKAHRKKEQITRDNFVDNPNIDLFFASAHSKIISVKTKCGNYYSIEGSGNLSFNSRIEQYVIDNDKDLYNFTDKWTEKIKDYLKGKKELVLT